MHVWASLLALALLVPTEAHAATDGGVTGGISEQVVALVASDEPEEEEDDAETDLPTRQVAPTPVGGDALARKRAFSVTLQQGLAGDADGAEEEDDEDVVHVVEAGESLSSIAVDHGLEGDGAWRRLFDANPEVEHPDLVEPGTELRIPDEDEELERRDLPAPPPEAEQDPGSRGATGAGDAEAQSNAASTQSADSGTQAGGAAGGGVWDRLAECESGGNWHLTTGNGYYGGLQFSLSSWRAVGGTGYPHEHSRETQIQMAERLQARQGWGAWPACARKLGLGG